MSNSSPSRASGLARLTPWRHEILDRLLDQALELEEGEREAFVERCARRAPRTGAWLKRLVQASARPTLFVEGAGQRLMGSTREATRQPAETLPEGTRLGAWRLIEPVGRGGMGQVYRAERADGAFEMQVAVKLILHARKGLAEILERERRLLAQLNDPAITRLLDGGLTEDGQPYLVMEWISGQDLTRWIHEGDRSTAERINLFREIVRALAAAHRGLVVHGDIKPSNIRITSGGRVKLLDFGLARLQSEDDRNDQTLALTPGFSAPELLQGESPSVATDIYSMGMLLAWLMEGNSENHAFDPEHGRWSRLPRGRDLAAIARKAAAKAPEARHASTEKLLDDLERLDTGWPVSARPPGPAGRAGLWFRRNRWPVTVGAVLAAGIFLAGGHALWQAEQTRLEADRAWLASRHAEVVNEFLVSLFEHADPFATGGEEVTARDLLDQGIERIAMLEETPEVQIDMLRELSRVSSLLGDAEVAEELLQRAYGVAEVTFEPPHEVRAEILSALGAVAEEKGEYDASLDFFDRADQARPPDNQSFLADLLTHRANTLIEMNRYDEAEEKLSQAMKIQEQADDQTSALVRTLNTQGRLYTVLDQHDRALEVFERALEISREQLGESHDKTLALIGNIAHTHGGLGDRTEAERQYQELLEIRRRYLGDRHPDLAVTLHQIGITRLHDGRPEDARPALAEAVELREEHYPEGHPSLFRSQNALAGVLRETGDLDGAEDMIERALAGSREAHGDHHVQTAAITDHLAVLRMDQGEFDTARQLHKEALEVRKDLLGEVHSHVANSYRGLARLFLEAGEPDKAVEWADRALENYKEQHSDPEHPEIRRARELRESVIEAMDSPEQ